MSFRVAVLAVAVGAFAWFTYGQDASAAAISQRAADILDNRPVKSVLIVGNSRTYVNDMPAMLRALGHEPESRVNVEVESSTAEGASFEDHWAKPRTKRLLAAGWDEVILQGESAAQASREQAELFQTYGKKLAGIARVTEGRPTLLVSWPYDPQPSATIPNMTVRSISTSSGACIRSSRGMPGSIASILPASGNRYGSPTRRSR